MLNRNMSKIYINFMNNNVVWNVIPGAAFVHGDGGTKI